jgi:hypothetical protein
VRILPVCLDEDTVGVLRRDRLVIGCVFAVAGVAVVWRVGAHDVLPALLGFTCSCRCWWCVMPGSCGFRMR